MLLTIERSLDAWVMPCNARFVVADGRRLERVDCAGTCSARCYAPSPRMGGQKQPPTVLHHRPRNLAALPATTLLCATVQKQMSRPGELRSRRAALVRGRRVVRAQPWRKTTNLSPMASPHVNGTQRLVMLNRSPDKMPPRSIWQVFDSSGIGMPGASNLPPLAVGTAASRHPHAGAHEIPPWPSVKSIGMLCNSSRGGNVNEQSRDPVEFPSGVDHHFAASN